MDLMNAAPPVRRLEPDSTLTIRPARDGGELPEWATQAPPRRHGDDDRDRDRSRPADAGALEQPERELRVAASPAKYRATVPTLERMRVQDLSISYGQREVVHSVSLPIRQGEVLALIGPSGCGKTTLLRSLNRLTELTKSASFRGRITLDGADITALEPTALRRRVTMVFQQPNPFPMSIFDNVAYVLREQARRKPRRQSLRPQVEEGAGARRPARRGPAQPRPPGAAALRRPAAAALHRTLAGGKPGGAAAGRALLGAGPAVDAGDRGPDRQAARGGCRGDRHPTTCSRLTASPITLRSCTSGSWWSTRRRRASSTSPASSARGIT